ncbi:hypothetical protein AMST5_00101 [freshwater sediment metagenome]|uniref:Novel STAND NTPase 1 domain-containing protein n=1 Tax=freshwater sediment metagenome TaxID=556182 RepID=A0AA48LYJ6_9ZZZZ
MSSEIQRFCDAFNLSREILELRPSSDDVNSAEEKNRWLKEQLDQKCTQLRLLRYPIDGIPRPEPHAYPGLRPFRPVETEIFFGRDAEAEALRRSLSESQTVIVLGGSGSGKSSLVLAGVLPLLNRKPVEGRTGRWYYGIFRPGDRPIDQILDALAEPLKTLLLLSKGRAALQQFRDRDLDETLDKSIPRSVAYRKQFLSGKLRQFLKTKISDEKIDACVRDVDVRQETASVILSEIFNHWRCAPGSEDRGQSATGLIDAVSTFILFLEEIDAIFDALNDSYRAGAINFLLLADQFEEFFRPVTSDKVSNDPENMQKRAEVQQFVKLMEWTKSPESKAFSKLIIVGTLRSEELHRCAEFEGLAEIVNNGFYLLDRPSRDELTAATVEPAGMTLDGWDVPYHGGSGEKPFDSDFLQKIIADDKDKSQVELFQINSYRKYASSDKLTDRHQADLLPLFQHLLRITWRTAILRWDQDKPQHATVEYEKDISSWLREREDTALRVISHLTQPIPKEERAKTKQLELPDNILEKCFDICLTITIAESVIFDSLNDKRLDDFPKLESEIDEWIESSSQAQVTSQRRLRLNLIRATFVCLARKDDKGNLARNPTHADTILSAAGFEETPDNRALLDKTLKLLRLRNYITLGKEGKYDIGHEAMIRNSSLYRFWLDQTDEIEAALYTARMLVKRGQHPGISLHEMEESEKLFSSKEIYERLMLIFDPEAKIFSPVWLSSRIGESPEEQERLGEASVEDIEHVWQNVRRWRLGVGTEWKPRIWSEVLAAKLSSAPRASGKEISGTNSQIKIFTRRLGYGLLFVLSGWAGLLAYDWKTKSAEAEALGVFAVVSDQASKPPGRDAEFVKPILKGSAKKIKKLGDSVGSGALSMAKGGFNTAVRRHFSVSYLVKGRDDWEKSDGWPSLSCAILKPNNQAVSFQSQDQKRKLAYSEEAKRYVLTFNQEDAEIRRADSQPSSFSLPTDVDGFLCASPTLDYIVLWSNPKNSLPAVFPIAWLKSGNIEKGVISGQPWPAIAPPIPFMQSLVDLKEHDVKRVAAKVLFRKPWYHVTMKIRADDDNYVGLRFARGVLEPEIVSFRSLSKELAHADCKPSSESAEIYNCTNYVNVQVIRSPIGPANDVEKSCDLCNVKVIVRRLHDGHNIILAETPEFKSTRISKVYQIGDAVFLGRNEGDDDILKIDYDTDHLLDDLGDLPQASYSDEKVLKALKNNKTSSMCDAFECLEWENEPETVSREIMTRVMAFFSQVRAFLDNTAELIRAMVGAKG